MGVKLDEESTVSLLALTCNVVYSVSIGVGFLTLPREFMLRVAGATIILGPACVSINPSLLGRPPLPERTSIYIKLYKF